MMVIIIFSVFIIVSSEKGNNKEILLYIEKGIYFSVTRRIWIICVSSFYSELKFFVNFEKTKLFYYVLIYQAQTADVIHWLVSDDML